MAAGFNPGKELRPFRAARRPTTFHIGLCVIQCYVDVVAGVIDVVLRDANTSH